MAKRRADPDTLPEGDVTVRRGAVGVSFPARAALIAAAWERKRTCDQAVLALGHGKPMANLLRHAASGDTRRGSAPAAQSNSQET